MIVAAQLPGSAKYSLPGLVTRTPTLPDAAGAAMTFWPCSPSPNFCGQESEEIWVTPRGGDAPSHTNWMTEPGQTVSGDGAAWPAPRGPQEMKGMEGPPGPDVHAKAPGPDVAVFLQGCGWGTEREG